jgi:hypothetical protein
MPSSDVTPEYAEAMNEAIDATSRAESERDEAKAKASSLKRKYEPDTGILLSKMLRLSDDVSGSFMRVTVRTGGYLLLELIPRVRNNGNLPNWGFQPSIEGKHDHMQDFGDYGTYEIHIGDGCGLGHDCLVHFRKPATVEITDVTEPGLPPDELFIEELTKTPEVTLAMRE